MSFSTVAGGFWFYVGRYDYFLVRRCGRIFASGLRRCGSVQILIFSFFPTYVFGFLLAVYRILLPSLSPPLRTMFCYECPPLRRSLSYWLLTQKASDIRSLFSCALLTIADGLMLWLSTVAEGFEFSPFDLELFLIRSVKSSHVRTILYIGRSEVDYFIVCFGSNYHDHPALSTP